MPQRRELREQPRLDVLTGDKHVLRLDPGFPRGQDDVLALDREQAELLAPPAFVQLANELQPLVFARGDHPASQSSHAPWKSPFATSSRAPGYTRIARP